MDQAIRNKLRSMVTRCRRLLEESVAQQLQGRYDIYATGKKDEVRAEKNVPLGHLTDEERQARQDILAHFEHILALGYKTREALDQLIREIAFTHLNRLCAYKMMEARDVYVNGRKFREAVSKRLESQGFLFYLADHPEDEQRFNAGQQEEAYRHFLNWLGGTLSREIGVLFSPTDPANRVYPPQRVLDEVLGLLNSEELKGIWSEDETIGWVYQYFTPKELRDQARKESQAPRNSYELAFRNQFFTPRYVVEFLTDNTLGRIWYEIWKGNTRLRDECRYMARRPTEIFLEPPMDTDAHGSEKSKPDISVHPCLSVADSADLSQEELLRQPVYIPYRPKKDPREIKILDPACGSGHFLLYCFALLLVIYEEAYDDELGPKLQADYPTKDDLRKALLGLILRHNLHGIDIDLRCTQIAALALWLRCQRAYQDMGLKKDRPRITRSNIVCAEPMPGEGHMLKEFVAQLEPKLLGQLVEVVFDKMKLAGEAGSLLKIEEEIRDAVAKAREQWRIGPVATQMRLFGHRSHAERQQRFDLSGITDSEFFEQAESKVVQALRSHAENAQNGQRIQRRLFADDAVRGFAFVDLCHKSFETDPKFQSPFLYTRMTAKAVRQALIDQKGWTDENLPHRNTIGEILNRLGIKLRPVRKAKPLKKVKETDAIFANVRRENQAADDDPHVVRISMDAKAKVAVGDYSRDGESRGAEPVQGWDHDPEPEQKLVSQGILDVLSGLLSIFIATSNGTSDFIADCLVQWWEANQARYPNARRLVINRDNGPENSSHRTQFMNRIVMFADATGLEIKLVYYPPYHSKYHPVERCWGILERHWNGILLNSVKTVVEWARTMTWKGAHPIVSLIETTYDQGVRIAKNAFEAIESRLQRHDSLPKYDVLIQPRGT